MNLHFTSKVIQVIQGASLSEFGLFVRSFRFIVQQAVKAEQIYLVPVNCHFIAKCKAKYFQKEFRIWVGFTNITLLLDNLNLHVL